MITSYLLLVPSEAFFPKDVFQAQVLVQHALIITPKSSVYILLFLVIIKLIKPDSYYLISSYIYMYWFHWGFQKMLKPNRILPNPLIVLWKISLVIFFTYFGCFLWIGGYSIFYIIPISSVSVIIHVVVSSMSTPLSILFSQSSVSPYYYFCRISFPCCVPICFFTCILHWSACQACLIAVLRFLFQSSSYFSIFQSSLLLPGRLQLL